MNLIVAGGDAVAVDAVCAALTGKQPLDFNFLKMAAQQKVGETNLSNIEVVGEEITRWIFREFKHVSIQKDAMLPAWLPAFLTAWMRSLLLDRPALRRRKCRRCGVCAKICAARAITLSKGRPVFNYNKCIGCYCCQEMCNFAAIKIRKSFLARVIFKISALFG
jgi:ferredoxin